MRWMALAFGTALTIGGCEQPPRNLDAELDVNFTTGELLLSCRTSSSGTCYAVILDENRRMTVQAAAGATSSLGDVTDGMDYCVDVDTPDPARCHPRPLVSGKQIVHAAKVRRS